jgi:biotin transport system substrate-specific component
MAIVALFAVLVGVGAQIRIYLPLSPVPMTLQTAMVLAAGLILGSRRAAISLFLYMILGLVGLPVFAGGGGPQNLLVPSFGFVAGFIPSSWVTGKICEAASRREQGRYFLPPFVARCAACLAGMFVYDVIGVIWLHMNLNLYLGKPVTFAQSLAAGLFPFILPDLLKLAAVVVIVTIVTNRVKSLDLFK